MYQRNPENTPKWRNLAASKGALKWRPHKKVMTKRCSIVINLISRPEEIIMEPIWCPSFDRQKTIKIHWKITCFCTVKHAQNDRHENAQIPTNIDQYYGWLLSSIVKRDSVWHLKRRRSCQWCVFPRDGKRVIVVLFVTLSCFYEFFLPSSRRKKISIIDILLARGPTIGWLVVFSIPSWNQYDDNLAWSSALQCVSPGWLPRTRDPQSAWH